MKSGIINGPKGQQPSEVGISGHLAIPTFEQLEPRLLLSADVSGLQLAVPALDNSYEQAIEIDLDYQQEETLCEEAAKIEAIATLTSEDSEEVISPVVTLQDESNTNDISEEDALIVYDIGCVIVNLEPIALSSVEAQDNQAAKLTVYNENDILTNSEYTPIEIRGPPAGEIDSSTASESNIYASSDEFVESSDVGNIYSLQSPDLPGLQLVDTDISSWNGQIIYLDFDGAQDVTYNGPVTVGPFDVPRFAVPEELNGREEVIISNILSELEQTFAGTGIIFTISQPSQNTEYSTIYIGGNDSAFAEYGSFLGLAEQVDVGNQDLNDNGFVFYDSSVPGCNSIGRLVTYLEGLISHETGHLLGYTHSNKWSNKSELLTTTVLQKVAYAQEVHTWIVAQAAAFYANQYGEHQLQTDYLGNINNPSDAQDGIGGCDAEDLNSWTGTTVIEGAYEEDTQSVWLRHFAEGGDSTELTTGLPISAEDLALSFLGSIAEVVPVLLLDPDNIGSYVSAYTAAIDMFNSAVDQYLNLSNPTGAYYLLGRVAHLLADMTVPAHVNLDRHPIYDTYEDEIASDAIYKGYDVYFEDYSATSALGFIREYANLESLFRETVDYTDDYDSDDSEGDQGTGQSFSSSRLSTLGLSTRHKPDQVDRSDNEIDFHDVVVPCNVMSGAELRILANDLMPWAIEQTATLYRLF